MEWTLFVHAKLTFSEYLRCLNFLLWTLWPAKTKQVLESNLFLDTAPTRSGKFKHLKFSENVNFARTNNVDSILKYFTFNKILDFLVKIAIFRAFMLFLGDLHHKLRSKIELGGYLISSII